MDMSLAGKVAAGKVAAAERVTLVLSGGSALGAFQGGALEAMHLRGMRPERIVATSIGAVNAAIFAGNPPETRVECLRRFWTEAARDGVAWTLGAGFWSDDRARVLPSPLLGSPAVFRPRFPGGLSLLPGMPSDASLYDLAPLRASLERAVDFERLNGGDMRLTVVAVDVTTGEEVHFDTDRTPLGPDHLLACSGFIPFFPPVEIDGRLLGDGGMAANLPLEAALDDTMDGGMDGSSADDRLCIAIDLFHRRGERPRTVGQAMDRQLDLLLTSQTAQALRSLRRVHELRRHLRRLGERLPEDRRADTAVASALAEGAKDGDGATTLLLLSHAPVSQDAALRAFDFSRAVLTERWQAGRTNMEKALRSLDGHRAAPGEFAVRVAGGE